MFQAARRVVITVVAVYAVVVCWLTWPLAAHLSSQLPATTSTSTYDPLYSAWALSWESHALAQGRLDLADANIYAPARDALFYGPAALGALPYFAPPYLLTGNPALALNLMLLACFALTAAAVHLVVHAWTGLHAAGAVAAATILSNRWLVWTFVPGVPHLAVLLYFPVIIWIGAAGVDTWRAAALLVALLVLQCATDISYVAPAVLVPLSIIAAWRLLRGATRAAGLRLALAIAAAALIVAALHAPYLSVAVHNPNLASQTNWRDDLSHQPLGIPAGLLGPLSPLSLPTLVFVLLAGVGAAVSWRRWRGSAREASAVRHALLWSVLGVLISLPTYVRVLGHEYALPHLRLLDRLLPVGGILRVPERLGVAALIAIALLVGLLFAELLRQLDIDAGHSRRGRALGAAVAALCILAMYGQYVTAVGQPRSYGTRLPARYALRAPPGDSPVLQAVRAAGGAVLELPLPRWWPTNPMAHAPAMYRSTFHWQPLLNGYSSYWPDGFEQRMRLATRLPDADALRALRQETGLQLILVRLTDQLPIDASLATERAAWIELARSGGRHGLRLVASDDSLALFRLTDEWDGS